MKVIARADGSTVLMSRLGPAYAEALDEQRQVLRRRGPPTGGDDHHLSPVVEQLGDHGVRTVATSPQAMGELVDEIEELGYVVHGPHTRYTGSCCELPCRIGVESTEGVKGHIGVLTTSKEPVMFDQGFAEAWPQPGRGDLAVSIAGVVAGHSRQQIADDMGVSVSTLARRLHDRVVLRAVAEARAEQRRQMQARLATSATRALDVLDELLDHPDEATRLRAVNTALTHPLRYQLAQPAEPDTEPAPEADNPIAMGALRTHTSERAWDADTVPAPEDVAEGDDGE